MTTTKVRRPALGKWFFRASWGRDFQRFDPFVRRLEVCWIKKIAEAPEHTVPVHGKHYKGCRFVMLIRLPGAEDALTEALERLSFPAAVPA